MHIVLSVYEKVEKLFVRFNIPIHRKRDIPNKFDSKKVGTN